MTPADGVRARLLELEDRRLFVREELAPLSGNLDDSIRVATARAMGRIRNPAALPLVALLASDPAPEVRREAAFALGLLRGAEARGGLEALLDDGDPEVVSRAVVSLGWIGDPASLAPIRKLLGSPSAPRRAKREALLSLHRYRDDAAVLLASGWAQGSERDLREAAVYSLGRRPTPDAAQALRKALADSSPFVRASATRGLGVLARPEDLLRVATRLSDPDPQVRTNAIRAVGAIAGKAQAGTKGVAEAVAALVGEADGSDLAHSRTAVEALAAISGAKAPEGAAALEKLLGSPRADLREEAVVSLARSLPSAFVARAEALGADPSPRFRSRLAEAAGLVPVDEVSSRLLVRLLADPEAQVRAAAVGAIREGEWPAVRPLVLRLLDDPDVVVRSETIARIAKAKDEALPGILETVLARADRDESNDAALAAVAAAAELAPRPEGRKLVDRALALMDPIARRAAREALIERWSVPPSTIPEVEFEPRAGASPSRLVALSRTRPLVRIETDRGELLVRLRPDEAPATVASFLDLTGRGYFDGILFHRVVPNFVVQTGDPRGDGSGGPGWQLRDEINPLPYVRGAIGMALSGPDTGGSQFFVTHSPQPHLDGGYTVFGSVVGGRDVIDRIARGDRIRRIVPLGEVPFAAESETGLSGDLDPETILGEVRGWRERAAASVVDPKLLGDLRLRAAAAPFDLVVVFRPGDEASGRVVPELIRLLREAPDLEVGTTFVAYPSDPEKHPIPGVAEIRSLPTILLSRSGREIGRIEGEPAGGVAAAILGRVEAGGKP
jgi:cyclophilin family peptidyl-prolyl cis-trans isomerase/HEAT repeat protein